MINGAVTSRIDSGLIFTIFQTHAIRPQVVLGGLILLTTAILPKAVAEAAGIPGKVVTYEAFGATGDGETDDLPAICKAHRYANQHGLPVRSKPEATYHLGRKALTAIIMTDTDWNTSRFIIDDSQGVESRSQSVFEVRSALEAVPLEIGSLKRGQKRLDLRPERDCLVYVENKHKRLFIRKGLNRNDGKTQSEVFILKRDGTIEGGIDWDYDQVTQVSARPIDDDTLILRGGVFTSVANQAGPDEDSGYWSRNIHVTRSKTLIENVTQTVIGEGESGTPYGGFLRADRCAHVMFRDCKVDGRKTYRKIGNAGKPVPMGTYGYHASYVVDFRMIRCTTGTDIMDRSRWGVVASNFMKDFLVEDCALSRVDVHMGVSGNYIIRNSALGHAGLNAIGRGRLVVENSTLHGRNLVMFRQDYGSTWDGEVLVKDCRWIPGNSRDRSPVVFGTANDGTHDFGYPCSMPSRIRIDGLFIDDSEHPEDYQGPVFFNDVLDASKEDLPSPYLLVESLDVSGLRTASGKKVRVSTNPEMNAKIDVTGL